MAWRIAASSRIVVGGDIRRPARPARRSKARAASSVADECDCWRFSSRSFDEDVPSNSLRAVRRIAVRVTISPSIVAITVISPVGCSIDSVFSSPSGSRRARAAGASGSRQAVATLTAPRTPMEAWQRCGMKVRVEIAPPARGRRDHRHLRHRLRRSRRRGSSAARPSGGSPPAAPRSAVVRLELRRVLVARDAEVGGAHHHAGHAVVDQRARRRPRSRRRRCPVGSSAPQVDPAVSSNAIGTGRVRARHAVDPRVARRS